MAEKAFGKAAAGPNDVLTRSDRTADGCCRLSVASTTTLNLKPLNGNTLWVGGQACTIPSAGGSISNSGLSASTLYYVYATASGGIASSLSLSTTGHVTGSDGREYLSNSGSAVTPSRLVGMATTDGYGNFAAVLNWFNRRAIKVQTAVTGATSSSSMVAILTSSTLTWADEFVTGRLTGAATLSIAGYQAQARVYMEMTAGSVGAIGSISAAQYPTASAPLSVSAEGVATLPEGSRAVQVWASIPGNPSSNPGTASFAAYLTVETRG